MMIFRILCGEWIEPLWDCMRAEAKVVSRPIYIYISNVSIALRNEQRHVNRQCTSIFR